MTSYSDQSYNLRIELDTKNCECTPEQIEQMERALSSLDRVTADFPVSDLYVTIIHHARSQDFHVKTALVLSGRTLFTGERHHEMYTAYEQCIDKLLRKVTSYKSRLDDEGELSKLQKGTAQEIVASQVPHHEAMQQAVDDEDYFAFRRETQMFEEGVRKRVGRWLQRYPDLNELIGQRLEIADFVEGVFLTAFDRFYEKPTEVPPGDWLESLIDRVIHEIADDPDQQLEVIRMVRSAQDVEGGV
jgi:ribosome-associated translation inhibitor RaiA